MINIKKTWILALFCGYIYAQEVHDPAVMAGSIVNLVDNASTIKKAADKVGDVQAVEGVINNLDTILKNPTDAMKQALANKVVKYTNSKASVIAMIDGALQKVNGAIDKVAKRVDMWRTTKPTLERYYEASARLLDDTKLLMQSFTWKSYFAINSEERWGKKLEYFFDADKYGNNWRGAYVDLAYSFAGYAKKTYLDANNLDDEGKKKREEEYKAVSRIFLPKVDKRFVNYLLNADGQLDSSKIPNYQHRIMPMKALDYSGTVIFALRDLEASFYHKVSDSLTWQDSVLKHIADELGKSNQTMVDTKELSNLIMLNRGKVRVETADVMQIHANVELYYTNFFLRDKMMTEQAAREHENSLQVLAAGMDDFIAYQEWLRRQRGGG